MVGVVLEIALFIVLFFVFKSRPTRNCNAFLTFDNTDFLRGLAILMIIVMHSCANMHDAKGFSSLGGIGVSLFLMLSAYGLSESYKKNGIQGFLKKKMLRIWIPYALFLVVVTCTQGKFDLFGSKSFYLDIFCIKTSYWFISFLMYNYLLFWITKKINKQWFSCALFFIFGIVIFGFDDRIRAEQVLSFPAGLVLSNYKDEIKAYIESHKIIISSIIAIILAVSLIMFVVMKIVHSNELLLSHTLLMYKFFVAHCLVLFFNTYPPISKFTKFAASISLELYLVHFSLYTIIPDNNHQISSMACFLTLSFLGAYLFHSLNKMVVKFLKQ